MVYEIINTKLINQKIGESRLTDSALARQAKVSRPTVIALRNGTWNGNLATLKAMIGVLNMKLADVILDADEKE